MSREASDKEKVILILGDRVRDGEGQVKGIFLG